MKRRSFLIGVAAVSVGSGVVIGSGALSSAETARRTKIEVVSDSDAYVRMEKHPDSNWSDGTTDSPAEFTVEEDAEGHLGLLIDAVRNDTRSRFDNVIRLCNTGKQCVCVWVDEKVGGDTDRVTFYDSSEGADNTIEGEENAVAVGVGECMSIGVEVDAEGLEGRNRLLEDITVKADTDAECDCDEAEQPPEGDETAIATGTEFPGANPFTYFEYTGDDYTTDLVAGREEEKVGEITVTEVGNGEIELSCETNGDWLLYETKVAVADEEPEVHAGNEWIQESWMTTSGNPIPGRFPVKREDNGVSEVVHTIDIGDREYPAYIAAHAEVGESL